jgi:8-oxo-dGTP pyrophosphatase MutT (NUDIX family)
MSITKHEYSAGAVLVSDDGRGPRLLLIRLRKSGYELPKGHIEDGESAAEAALRELHEETGLITEPVIGPEIARIKYGFRRETVAIIKDVRYFLMTLGGGKAPNFGKRPPDLRDMMWIAGSDIDNVQLIKKNLRPILRKAMAKYNAAQIKMAKKGE